MCECPLSLVLTYDAEKMTYDAIKEDLLKVMKRKLELFGDIARMDNCRNNISVVMGMMDGDNRRGRPYREWLDDIKEWCQKDIHLLFRIVQDGNKWRQVVKIECVITHSILTV